MAQPVVLLMDDNHQMIPQPYNAKKTEHSPALMNEQMWVFSMKPQDFSHAIVGELRDLKYGTK